jgi:hypothetical protein
VVDPDRLKISTFEKMRLEKTYKGLPTAKENTNSGSVPLTPSELKSLKKDMKAAIDTLKRAFPKARFL